MHPLKVIAALFLLSPAAMATEEGDLWKFHKGTPPQKFLIDTHQSAADLLIQLDPAGLFVMTVLVKDPHVTVADLRFDSYALHLFNIQSLPQGTLFSAEISHKDLKAFVHGLTSAQEGTLTTDGGAEAQISLAGTSSAVDTLNAYAASNNLTLPPPFTPSRPAGDELSADMQALKGMVCMTQPLLVTVIGFTCPILIRAAPEGSLVVRELVPALARAARAPPRTSSAPIMSRSM